MPPRKERRQNQALQKKRKSRFFVLYGALLAVLAAFALGSVYAATKPMPMPSSPRPTVFYGETGTVIAKLYPDHRDAIPYSDIPKVMQNAVVATEDRTFWHNVGIVPTSIARAALADLSHGGFVQGGSTITQQLAKNVYLTDQKSLLRKFFGVFLALRLTATYSKQTILTKYLNTVYFGHGAWGLQAAAQVYFGIPAKQLNLEQSALLAGLVEAPSAFDPYTHPQKALARRAIVLERMQKSGYISAAQAKRLSKAPLNLSGIKQALPLAPYFIDYVMDVIAKKDPILARDLSHGGYKVYTTLNAHDQQAANTAVHQHYPAPSGKTAAGPEAALVAIDPTSGYITAMVGGRSYAKAPYNRAVSALRQPGSTFKPFLYAALISGQKYTAASMMDDAPVTFPGGQGQTYTPKNASKKHLGPMLVRRALAISDNVVAVKWADIVGPDVVASLAHRMGITSPIAKNLTLPLGTSSVTPLEMADAYAPFANAGYHVKPIAVLKVKGPGGQVLFSDQPASNPVLSAQVAFIMQNLMQSVLGPNGTGAGLASGFNFQAAGKTGTSSHNDDGWFVGFSTHLVAAAWVGYDQAGKSLSGEGATTAGPVWSTFMKLAENQNPPPPFLQPPGVVSAQVSTLDGLLANGTEPSITAYFISGTQPTQYSSIDYTGPWKLWPDATTWYYANYGPNPADPLWSRLMNFPSLPSSGSQSPPHSGNQ